MMPSTEAPPERDLREGAPRRRRVVALVGSATVLVLAMIFSEQVLAIWDRVASTLTDPDDFREWVEGLGALGPLVFFAAQVVQVMLAPIPGTLFPPVGSVAFGPWAALVLSLAGMAVGSALVFLVSRRWGRPLAVRLAGEDRVRRYGGLLAARGGLVLWLVFLLPLLPDDLICLLAGISGISFRRFLVIATVGRLPAVAVGVFTMAGLEGAPPWAWALAAALFLALSYLAYRQGPILEARLARRVRARRWRV